MVIDTSALIAILLLEPEASLFEDAIATAPIRLMSSVSRVELSFVIESRKGEAGRLVIDRLLQEADIEIAAVTPQQATLAIGAFRAYGKGRHPAALNIGDCFSYALARATQYPLLFKGEISYEPTSLRPCPDSKQSFFEKKDQKTFFPGCLDRVGAPRTARASRTA